MTVCDMAVLVGFYGGLVLLMAAAVVGLGVAAYEGLRRIGWTG